VLKIAKAGAAKLEAVDLKAGEKDNIATKIDPPAPDIPHMCCRNDSYLHRCALECEKK
jgi:hypothetical protein